MAMQQRTQAGITLRYMMGDLDFVSAGTVEVFPSVAYWLVDIEPESQIELLQLYLGFLLQKSQEKAKEAGLILPGETKGRFK